MLHMHTAIVINLKRRSNMFKVIEHEFTTPIAFSIRKFSLDDSLKQQKHSPLLFWPLLIWPYSALPTMKVFLVLFTFSLLGERKKKQSTLAVSTNTPVFHLTSPSLQKSFLCIASQLCSSLQLSCLGYFLNILGSWNRESNMVSVI